MKFNLSFKRIVSRLFLTFVIGLIFGVAMYPFMRVANGLYYSQRSAIGTENLYRMILIWGFFTLLVTIFSFTKKHFRMVSVLLIGCWILSLIVSIYSLNKDISDIRCRRSYPFDKPKEITRALDLLSQRWGIDTKANGTLIQNPFNYFNCLDIQYSQSDSTISEAYFLDEKETNLQDLKIFLNPSYKNMDDLTLATLLTHELIHVGQKIDQTLTKRKYDCYFSEAQAFTSEAMFLSWLNEEERRSINTRLQNNTSKNPGLAMLILIQKRQDESYVACDKLRNTNKSTQDQFNQCVWDGLQNKIEQDIRNDPEYQKQCSDN